MNLERTAKPKPEVGSGRDSRRARAAERRAEREKEERRQEAKDAEVWKALRWLCYLRDHRKCRAFGTPVLFLTDSLFKLAHPHHVIFKSQGGKDTSGNVATLSYEAHKLIHDDGLLTCVGNSDGTLTFTLYEWAGGTRKFVRSWESTVNG